jgi:outer membrane protein OmpA-like peptidoglycan-associated protein
MNQTIARSNVEELAPAEVTAARRLLANAERVNQKKPDSNLERHLANLSHAKFEEAVAEAHRRGIESRQAEAQATLSEKQMQVLDAERKARLEAEERLRGIATFEESEEGTVITLTGAVLFESDQSNLLPIAKDRLREVAEALQGRIGAADIRIEGHADAQGPDEYNEELSMRRAEAVKSFLVELGVPDDRIRAEGHGEKEPIATNETPEGRANNRRVEIVLEDDEA